MDLNLDILTQKNPHINQSTNQFDQNPQKRTCVIAKLNRIKAFIQLTPSLPLAESQNPLPAVLETAKTANRPLHGKTTNTGSLALENVPLSCPLCILCVLIAVCVQSTPLSLCM